MATAGIGARRFISRSYLRDLLLGCQKCAQKRQRRGFHVGLVGNSFWSSPDTASNLKSAMTDAEKLVGYPTTFSSLKHLVDAEPANFIGLAKKLVGSGHPLLSTARDLLSHDPYNAKQLGGLWVLLLSKAAGTGDVTSLNDVIVNGINQRQRIVAETTELINTAFLIHRSMLNLAGDHYLEDLNKKTLSFGNRLSVLGGDYLLSKASLELSKLQNTDCVEYMSQAIGDMSEGAVLEETETNVQDWTIDDWERYVFLTKGSLMANSCKAALALVHREKKLIDCGYAFGRYLTLAQQICNDVDSFNDKKSLLSPQNFVLWLSLFHEPSLLPRYKLYLTDITDAKASDDLRDGISSSNPSIVVEAGLLCDAYVEQCKIKVKAFQEVDTVAAIQKILTHLKVS